MYRCATASTTPRSPYVDDEVVADAEFRTRSGHYALAGEGLAAGRDSADPVSKEYSSGFAFTGGQIHKVIYDVGIHRLGAPTRRHLARD